MMIKTIFIAMLMVCIMAFSASAFTVVNNNSTISIVGDDTVTGKVTISTNDETDNITVSAVTPIEFDDFNATVTFTSTSMAPNTSTTVEYTISVPDDIGGEYDGYLNFTSASNTSSAAITLDVSQLKFSDLDVKVGGSYDKNIHDEDEYRIDVEAEPGDKVVFEFELENLYSGDGDADLDIEDVAITIIIENIDDGDDLEEEIDDFDIRYDDKESVSASFEVPLKAVSDTYTVTIEVDAEDEDGNDFSFTKEYDLVVDRDSHKIAIEKAYLTQTELKCDRSTTLKVDIINIGERYEDDVEVIIKNEDLNLEKKETGLELDEDPDDDDNEMTLSFSITVGDDIAAGSYLIDIRTYYDDKASDLSRVELIVGKCTVTVPDVEDEEEVEEIVILPQQESDIDTGAEEAEPVTTVTGSQPIKESFRDSAWFVVILVILNIAIIGVAFWLVLKFLVK